MSFDDPRDNVSRMVYRLMRGPQIVIMNPETVQKEIEKGGAVQFVQDKPVPQAIEELFDDRKKHALEVASKLIRCPTPKPLLIYQYRRQLGKAEAGLHGMNTAQAGNVVEHLGS